MVQGVFVQGVSKLHGEDSDFVICVPEGSVRSTCHQFFSRHVFSFTKILRIATCFNVFYRLQASSVTTIESTQTFSVGLH